MTDTLGHCVTTNKIVCSIEMRVNHNGYYGGSLEVNEYQVNNKAPVLDDF